VAYSAAKENAAGFRRIPLDDAPAARALEEQARKLAIHFPEAGSFVGEAIDIWIARAVAHRTGELKNLMPGDWAAFDRTAPGRRALTEIGVVTYAMEARDVLARAEEDWVNDSVEALIERADADEGPPAGVWRDIEKNVLALDSLDADEGRFKSARRRLFDLAHASASADAARHIKAGRYNRAFGVARKHAVEWNATANVLGARDVKKLDSLREKCAALVTPDGVDPSPADETDIAPPPRTKPEK